MSALFWAFILMCAAIYAACEVVDLVLRVYIWHQRRRLGVTP